MKKHSPAYAWSLTRKSPHWGVTVLIWGVTQICIATALICLKIQQSTCYWTGSKGHNNVFHGTCFGEFLWKGGIKDNKWTYCQCWCHENLRIAIPMSPFNKGHHHQCLTCSLTQMVNSQPIKCQQSWSKDLISRSSSSFVYFTLPPFSNRFQ